MLNRKNSSEGENCVINVIEIHQPHTGQMGNKCDNVTNYNGQILYFNCSNFSPSFPMHGIYKEIWLSAGVANLILAPVTFLINFITFVALRKIKDKNTITYCIFKSLCATDMLTGLLAQSLYGVYYVTVFYKKTYCSLVYVHIGFGFFFVTVSFLCLFAIHIERNLGVFHPMTHFKIKTDTSFITRIILASWALTAIYIPICFFTPRLIMYKITAAVLITVVFVWSFYVQIKIIRRLPRIRSSHKVLANMHDVKTEIERHFGRFEFRANGIAGTKRHFGRFEFPANRIAGLILAAYTVCYIPTTAMYLWFDFGTQRNVLVAVIPWTETLVFLNSIINPLLFSLQKKEVQQIVVSLLRSLVSCCTPAPDYKVREDKGKTGALSFQLPEISNQPSSQRTKT